MQVYCMYFCTKHCRHDDTLLYVSLSFSIILKIFFTICQRTLWKQCNSVGGGEPTESYHPDMQLCSLSYSSECQLSNLQLDCTSVIPDMNSSVWYSQRIWKPTMHPNPSSSPSSCDLLLSSLTWPKCGKKKKKWACLAHYPFIRGPSHPSQIAILIRKNSYKVVAIGAHTLPLTVGSFSFLAGLSVPRICLWLYF